MSLTHLRKTKFNRVDETLQHKIWNLMYVPAILNKPILKVVERQSVA